MIHVTVTLGLRYGEKKLTSATLFVAIIVVFHSILVIKTLCAEVTSLFFFFFFLLTVNLDTFQIILNNTMIINIFYSEYIYSITITHIHA